MPDGNDDALTARTVRSLCEIDPAHWDAIANGADQPYYPFVAYDFLNALEASGSVAPEAGWAAHHLILERGGNIIGAMPLYLKGNSQGEFVFDHSWADAYIRAGGRYYPKMLGAIPFTPASGPRLLATNRADRIIVAAAAAQMAEKAGVSSLHINFPTLAQRDILEAAGFLIRTGQQFEFKDDRFGDWDGFLSALSSRKRKDLRKERASIREAGVQIEWITGSDITEAHLDQFWIFYQDTGARKWGAPYLTRQFFSMVVERMADKTLLIIAKQAGQTIAGALNFIGGDTLFGRYWGCTKHVPFLHFEVCYYQAIDYALAHGLTYVNGGAQGEHKIARGYSPITTYSAHWIHDRGFREAIRDFLNAERTQVADDIDYLNEFTPFKTSQ